MTLQLITIEQAQKIANESLSQLKAWIDDGKIETYNNQIVLSSLKAYLQKRLLKQLKLKFDDKINNNPEFLSSYQRIRKLDEIAPMSKEDLIDEPLPGPPQVGMHVIFIILGTLGFVLYTIFG
ncbi:hypothetical protein BKI52_24215 [marine bacterium AO1-C]|nr:hypothetical protein BKI52_24215 [marine bacterium AO1-C]